MNENGNQDVMLADDLSAETITLGILLSNRELFEKLLKLYQDDNASGKSKKMAHRLLSKEAHRRGMDLDSYIDLLNDFAYWLMDVSNIRKE